MENKHILRQKFFSIQLDSSDDQLVIANALNLVEKYRPRVIGIYIAQRSEIDLLPMMLKCSNVICAVPKIVVSSNEHIFFTNYYPGAPLEQNEKYTGYLEPISDNIVIPGLAFDMKGYRLGRGKGHYDKYLARCKAIKVGICRNGHLLTRIPKQEHDVRMDYVVTENMILRTTNREKTC